MFKLESYITPILLSYVDRYIKNFRLEDSQVSLWGGDASFHNLDLRLDVLEEELQLPFSVVSGHIRELLIHVPWTKLASQPITITINTIECILKLRGTETASSTGSTTTKEKGKRPSTNKQVIETPPGYVQLIINKIVSNIRIYCNNVILKYVEEDIVLSMNVKHLKFLSANEKWEPAYTDISPSQVFIRKLIQVNDLTLCLDKRNAAGKIDVYQEPMLYRCSMTMHLLRNYHSATANRASTTRLDIYCNKMEFGMTEQQIPMLYRLIKLMFALQRKEWKQQSDSESHSLSNAPAEFKENSENAESWTGWAWSYVASVLPTQWEEDWNSEQLNNKGHTVHIGFYVDNASLTFKISESSSDKSYYAHKRVKYWPILQMQLQGMYCESIAHGHSIAQWSNVSFGISQALLIPQSHCSCAYVDLVDRSVPTPYLTLGTVSDFHKTDSLFDAEAVENSGKIRKYNTVWEYHMQTNTEAVLLERTPAFALDFVYQMDVPDDMNSERLSEIGSNFEFSNLSEKSSLRVAFGSLQLNICSGLFHRMSTLQVAASYYDYPPYSVAKPDLPLQDLLPPSEEDFDALNEFISSRSTRITFFAPVIELHLMDHPYFNPVKGNLFKRRKISKIEAATIPPQDSPKLLIECQFLDISLESPMYENRLVHTTCQLPEPPAKLFDACYTKQNFKIVGLCGKLLISQKHTTILMPCTVSYSWKTILKPFYWTNPNIPHEEVNFETEGITINGTKPKMMVIYYIIDKLCSMKPAKTIKQTSLIADASRDLGMPYIELCIETIRFKNVTTNSTISTFANVGSIKAFIFEPMEKFKSSEMGNIQQVLFISGPEPKKSEYKPGSLMDEQPLLCLTMQYPIVPEHQTHPPILVFNIQEIRVCVDPLLCRWLLYVPHSLLQKHSFDPDKQRNKNISEASGSIAETPRKLSYHLESVHSSSESREPTFIPQKIPTAVKEEDFVDTQERIYNILKTWFDVWKGLLLCGDISQCTIYFPMTSLSTVGSQGIQEAIEQAMSKEMPPDIMVITLPFANIKSSQKQNIGKYLKKLPVVIPETVWSKSKSSFPWTISISELSCYTIQNSKKLIFLKPVSLNATVGLSTKPTKPENLQETTEIVQSSLKTDIGSLGVCVHIDMTPVLISTSEIQVYLFASIIYGLMEVANSLYPKRSKVVPKIPDIVPSVMRKSSTYSPTNPKENTIDTISNKTPPMSTLTDHVESDIKLTAWVQWTITRFTIELLSNEYKNQLNLDQPRLKLVVDAEDIVSSLDFQSVYLKIKSKIGSVSIQHYKRKPKTAWVPGPFSGIVMRLREDSTLAPRQEENGFITLTVTRANCKHTQALWSGVQKTTKKDKKQDALVSGLGLPARSRYITEIVVNVRPIDFVISLKTLQSFYLVIIPLLQIPTPTDTTQKESNMLLTFNNQNLPLAYLDCQDIRIIMPSLELDGVGDIQDVYIFEVRKITMSPAVENPICRTPCRPDIYDQAAHARILNTPGSEIEDRQYQLDILKMSVSTGVWNDIDSFFSPSGSVLSNERALSENPALEWNNLEKGQPNQTPVLNLWPITDQFDISVIIAPAMVYKETTVVCGHSLEVNFISDIFINISLDQIILSSALLEEFMSLLEPFLLESELSKRPKIRLPYSRFEATPCVNEEEDDQVENFRDSGIDTSDIRSLESSRVMGSASILTNKSNEETESQYVFPRPPNPLPATYSSVPFEILVTAGKIDLSIYNFESKDNSKPKIQKIIKTTPFTADDSSSKSVDSEDTQDSDRKYIPLIYISVNQPNMFLSKYKLGRRLQLSIFDLTVKLCGPDALPIIRVPTEKDFEVNLLENRLGTPDPITGISPAFFTIQFSKGIGKSAHLDVDILKPTKLLCDTVQWNYLIKVVQDVYDCFNKCSSKESYLTLISGSTLKSSVTSAEKFSKTTLVRKIKTSESFTQFLAIKELLYGITTVNLNFDQFIFQIKSKEDHELNINLKKMKNQLVISNRPERLTFTCSLSCITLNSTKENYRKLILNPWNLSFEICLFWEPWQSIESDPQVQISAESDCIIMDISPLQINCIEMVIKDLKDFIDGLPYPQSSVPKELLADDVKVNKDQHYKDDLRAGAFQFIDANSENTSELPLPYQVIFWNKNLSAMVWRYPQPRALTKVRVFPVPYKITAGSQSSLQVLCNLEYWSDYRNCYLPYSQFYLSESEICQLNLPQNGPRSIVASTWRVVINMINQKDEITSKNSIVSPRALAACMRIDSYFNKTLVPKLTTAIYITKIEVNLVNYFPFNTDMKMLDCLKGYNSDQIIPETQRFLTVTWNNLTTFLTCWKFDTLAVEVSSALKCDILDYKFLTEHSLMESFTYKLDLTVSDSLRCTFIAKPIQIRFGPSIAHTLTVSEQLWSQSYKNHPDFIIMSQYVVCNDSSFNIRFGQNKTDEDILLYPRYFHLYSWRSQKKEQELKLALETNGWKWSQPFSIQNDGLQKIEIDSETNTCVLISVTSISHTQKKITISGQVIVANMLQEHFELKVVEAGKSKEDVPIYIAAGKTCNPSIFINTKQDYFLRLRFYGLEAAWTGDIPLREHTTGAQPWLVKVPLQERGQFLSIWCKIVIQETQNIKRIMALLWPLFTIRSNLPVSAQVHIETPILNIHLDSVVHGKGECQQLYCPGTIDHSHQLTFALDQGITTSNPYVPLNYSLVDQQQFFKKGSTDNIDDILLAIKTCYESDWPYFGEEYKNIEWVVNEQPLTEVQIRYQNSCPFSSSLMVELIPWCLMVNLCGKPISVKINNVEMCMLKHNGIIAPPKLEETFNIGINLFDSWNFSGPLQLAKSDWSQTFFMPKISGTIPLEGSIKVPISREKTISFILLSSTLKNEIRLVNVASTHVLTNYTSTKLEVVCFAVPDIDVVYSITSEVNFHSFSLPADMNNSSQGIPIMNWFNFNNGSEPYFSDYILYIAFCVNHNLGWSRPIRIDKPLIRDSFSIFSNKNSIPLCLTSQEHKGQIFLGVHHDLRPQIKFENKTNLSLFCAQWMPDNTITKETQHFKHFHNIGPLCSTFYTMPILSERFPDLPQSDVVEKICLAYDQYDDLNNLEWSSPISIVNNCELFVKLPDYGDIKIRIKNNAITTFLCIETVSQIEISASDIRVKLSMQEKEGTTSKHIFEQPNQTVPIQSIKNVNMLMENSEDFPENMEKDWKSMHLTLFVNCVTLTLISETSDISGNERCELLNLICDNIALKVDQTEDIAIKLLISDIQIDNQLYSRESYDFPVVFIAQSTNAEKKVKSLNISLDDIFDDVEKNILCMDLVLETTRNHFNEENISGIKNVKVRLKPLAFYIEDVYITRLNEYFNIFIPNKLVVWPNNSSGQIIGIPDGIVTIPDLVLWQCAILARPLTIRDFQIEPLSVLLSVHCSIKLYIALDQSPLHFGKFEKTRLFTTSYRLGHALTMHYLSGAIFGAGWVVSSLELLGSPGGLARAMGTGLRDFVSMPYRGLVLGPMAFLSGIAQGSASLMRHITSGTLQSVTKLASSVARNLDRLTLDEEHLRRTEEQRRTRPQGLAQGFMQGLTGLGISILGAVGGIAHHPLQSVMTDGASPRSLAAGVGLGLVGVITKPLSGAAELISLTGQGLLQGAGWNLLPEARNKPLMYQIYSSTNSVVKYHWKLIHALSNSNILYVTEATCINDCQYDAVTLVLTSEALVIINTDSDIVEKVLSLNELNSVQNNDPTFLSLKLSQSVQKVPEDETMVEMDPDCRARVADYVRKTVGLLNLPDNLIEHSDFSISPLASPGSDSIGERNIAIYSFYVNPQNKTYFLCLLGIAKNQDPTRHFPIL